MKVKWPHFVQLGSFNDTPVVIVISPVSRTLFVRNDRTVTSTGRIPFPKSPCLTRADNTKSPRWDLGIAEQNYPIRQKIETMTRNAGQGAKSAVWFLVQPATRLPDEQLQGGGRKETVGR